MEEEKRGMGGRGPLTRREKVLRGVMVAVAGIAAVALIALVALLLGFEMSVEEMRERGLQVHPNTLSARDWMLSRGVTLEDT